MSRPVSARRSGWYSALPLRPVAAASALSRADQLSGPVQRQDFRGYAEEFRLFAHRGHCPVTKVFISAASAMRIRLGFTASQKAAAEIGVHGDQFRLHGLIGQHMQKLAVQPCQFHGIEPRRRTADFAEIEFAIRASNDARGSTASEVPIFAR